jgi:hypothetical protein
MDALRTRTAARRRPEPARVRPARKFRPRVSSIAALAIALTCPAGRGVEASGGGTYDPLLSESGNVCAPIAAGAPRLLQGLILAQTETRPFKPQPMQAAGGEVPLYDNLGTLSFKVGTRIAKAQAYFDQGIRWAFAFNHAEAQRMPWSK